MHSSGGLNRLILWWLVLTLKHRAKTLPTVHSTNSCQSLPTGVFTINPKGCEYFFYCHNGQALEAKCPGDLWFDIDSGICEKSESVQCSLNTKPLPPPNTLDEPVRCPILDSSDIITFLGSAVDCGRYYICYHGLPMRQQCISDMHWNDLTKKCDHPKNAKCRLKPDMPICPNNGQVFYPHPDQCHYFIYCYNGHSTVQQCPFYHHWDITTQSCRWRNLARCALHFI